MLQLSSTNLALLSPYRDINKLAKNSGSTSSSSDTDDNDLWLWPLRKKRKLNNNRPEDDRGYDPDLSSEALSDNPGQPVNTRIEISSDEEGETVTPNPDSRIGANQDNPSSIITDTADPSSPGDISVPVATPQSSRNDNTVDTIIDCKEEVVGSASDSTRETLANTSTQHLNLDTAYENILSDVSSNVLSMQSSNIPLSDLIPINHILTYFTDLLYTPLFITLTLTLIINLLKRKN
jgi:hypothetical protein